MNKTAGLTFKKLLGKGRAWLTPKGFTDELYDLFADPFEVLREVIINLKMTHFPSSYVNENNITNGEELFNITDIEGKTLEERSAEIESQWSIFAGSQNYKQIETILQKKNLPVYVIENIPQSYNLYGARVIGNGFLTTNDGETDPIVLTNGKHTFIIQSTSFYDESEFLSVVETVVKNKPAHNGAYFIPRYLRKKEIHNVMTKSEMQSILKRQYCDVKVEGEH